MTATPTASTSSKRAAVCVMAIGLGLTVVATIVPYVTDALAHHLDTGYPRYTEEEIATAVSAWLAIATTTGVLGVLCGLPSSDSFSEVPDGRRRPRPRSSRSVWRLP
jgi:hypothetical protein